MTARTATDDLLAAAGITPTAEGRQAARERLKRADAHWTSQRRQEAYEAHDRRVRDAA